MERCPLFESLIFVEGERIIAKYCKSTDTMMYCGKVTSVVFKYGSFQMSLLIFVTWNIFDKDTQTGADTAQLSSVKNLALLIHVPLKCHRIPLRNVRNYQE